MMPGRLGGVAISGELWCWGRKEEFGRIVCERERERERERGQS